MGTLATDDFNRTNASDIGANWDVNTSVDSAGFQIDSNKAIAGGDSGSDHCETYNAISAPDDQYVEVTLGPTSSGGLGTGYGLVARANSSTADFYRVAASGSGWDVAKQVSGAYTSLASDTGTTFTTGDTLRFQIIGTNWELFKNGSSVSSGSDSSHASGRGGIFYSSTDPNAAGNGIDTWEIGAPDVTGEIKTVVGLAIASVKTVVGLAKASIKKILGLSP